MISRAVLTPAFLAIAAMFSSVSSSALPVSPTSVLPAVEDVDLRADVAVRRGGNVNRSSERKPQQERQPK
jgi:hypothetical protein